MERLEEFFVDIYRAVSKARDMLEDNRIINAHSVLKIVLNRLAKSDELLNELKKK